VARRKETSKQQFVEKHFYPLSLRLQKNSENVPQAFHDNGTELMPCVVIAIPANNL
jgi:hypothetical protein